MNSVQYWVDKSREGVGSGRNLRLVTCGEENRRWSFTQSSDQITAGISCTAVTGCSRGFFKCVT